MRRALLPLLRLFIVAATALTAFVAPIAGSASEAADPEALTARLLQDGDASRIEIGLSTRVAFRIFALSEPNRLVVDFPALEWRLEPPRAGPELRLVEALRFGRIERAAARMVIDLRRPARVRSAYTEDALGAAPARLVLELEEIDEATFRAEVEAVEAEDTTGAPVTPRPRPSRGVVVAIDPGHGGVDSGAEAGSLQEKDLVLDYALALAALIDARAGFTARLTRETDVFLSLRERVETARAMGADIMISLHADALASGVATGASVFTLDRESEAEEAEALLHSGNRAEFIDGVDLRGSATDVASVLIGLSQRDTRVRSAQLAERMIAALAATTPVLEGRALQTAGFRVLKAPDIPSILIELGFLSSFDDLRRLTSKEGRDAIVKAIDEGVAAFVAADERLSAELEAVAGR